MPQQVINIGTVAGDGTGDTLRESQRKANENFSEIYTRYAPNLGVVVPTDTPSGTGINYWECIVAGTYTNFGGVVLGANSRGTIFRNLSGVFSISQVAYDITSKVNVSDVINTLVSTETAKPLSANQGKELNEKIIANTNEIANKANLQVGKNKFNKLDPTIISGKYLDGDTGAEVTYGTGKITHYIPIKSGETFFSNNSPADIYTGVVLYDLNKSILSVVKNTKQGTAAADGYIRFSLSFAGLATIDNSQVELGTAFTSYEPYSSSIPKVEIKEINESAVPLTIARVADLEGFAVLVPDKNKFNKLDATNISGSYLNGAGGLDADGSSYITHYIPILAGQTMHCSSAWDGSGVYNELTDVDKLNKVLVACDASRNVTATVDGFIRFSLRFFLGDTLNNSQVELGTTETAYEDYKLIVDNSQISKELQRVSKHTEITVKRLGTSGVDADFCGLNAIGDALASITDASEINTYTIIVEGHFLFTLQTDFTYSEPQFGEPTIIIGKNWVNVEGKGKNNTVVAVKLDSTQTFTGGKVFTDFQPIMWNCNSKLSKMKVISKNCRYSLHIESGILANDVTMDFEDVEFEANLEHISPKGAEVNGAVQFDLSGGWSEPFTENPFYPDNGDNPIWGDYQNYSLINVDTSQTYGSDLLYFAQDYYTILYIELPAGNYVFTYDEIVANNALDEDIIYSCSNTVEFEITQPDEFVIQSELSNDAQCNDEPSGSIDILCVTGGTAQDPDNDNCFDYSYSWVASNGGIVPVGQENLQDLTGLMAGTYNVTITDDQGCTYSESFNIDEPDPLTIVYDTKQEVNCFGGADGSISVTVNGGTPFVDPNDSSVIDYDFTITKDGQNFTSFIETYNGSNSFILSGLPAGTYTIVVTDQNNCDADQVIEVVIEEPQEITYTIDQTTLLDCFGDSDGEITITVSGGTPGYSLSLTGTSTAFSTITSDGDSYTFTGLTVGSYAITIQDANFVSSPSGCDVTTGSLIINEPEELIISNLSATEILCNADETSTITGTITGGTTNYEVVLIGPGVNEVSSDNTGSINFTDLGSGVYIVQVSDTNIATGGSGCYVEQSITIDEPDQLLISGVTSAYPDPETGFGVTAFGATDGTIDITVEGGTLPYSFQWTVISGGPISGSTTSEDLFNLPAGVYSVIATDDNGCSIEMQFEITEPEPFLIFEDLTLHVDVDCYGASTGELGVYVTGGTAPYDFEIANTTGDTPVVIDAVTNIDGNEYSIWCEYLVMDISF